MADAEKIDWEAMEPDWRAGIISKKQLSKQFGVSRAAIDKHWAKLEIERDLTRQIQAEAKIKVARATVTPGVTPLTRVTEQQVIESNATVMANKQIEHRTAIPLRRSLGDKLFAEIEGQTDGADLIEQLTLALQQGDLDELAKIARKVASLSSRIKGFSELVSAYKSLIALEREAFGINGAATPGETLDNFLASLDDA